MPCEESIADAKATFITAVAEGITTLVQQCGYSRDRATSVLLREMNRGESTRPSDTEVSQSQICCCMLEDGDQNSEELRRREFFPMSVSYD